MKRKSERTVLINFLILLAAALTYAALTGQASLAASAGGAFPVYRGQDEKSVSIQCIVDWDASAMEDIARVLKENGVCVTFAVTGEWAEKHPELLTGLVSRGNGIAVLAGESMEKDCLAVESITGIRPKICVLEKTSAGVMKECSRLGLTPVCCTVDLDTANGSAADIAARLDGNVRGGYIINVSPTREFAEALPEIIKKLKNMGLAIVPTHL